MRAWETKVKLLLYPPSPHTPRPPPSAPVPTPPTPDFTVKPTEWDDTDLYAQTQALKTTNPALKTLISIGGWSALLLLLLVLWRRLPLPLLLLLLPLLLLRRLLLQLTPLLPPPPPAPDPSPPSPPKTQQHRTMNTPGSGYETLFSQAVETASSRAQFIKGLLHFTQQYGFDG